jgi:nucleoside-specific channel-forming protein
MLKKCMIAMSLIVQLTTSVHAKEPSEIANASWMNLNLYRGIDQRGGPYPFSDTYVELEFGGRYEWLELYGYIDYLDAFNDPSSGKHAKDDFFVRVGPKISLDYLLQQDLSFGAVDELFLVFDIAYADAPPGSENGLKLVMTGVGSNINIPWLGLTGVNVYARYFEENYGASNEGGFDGYDFHLNWFKPLYFFSDKKFIAFQGYADYEFGSKMPNNRFEESYRTSDSFQSYLGFWLHAEKWALGYGLKLYNNMTQWKDGQDFNGKTTDTTGAAHYFNVTYKF